MQEVLKIYQILRLYFETAGISVSEIFVPTYFWDLYNPFGTRICLLLKSYEYLNGSK